MVGNEIQTENTDADRRRFLVLAAKLGIAAPPVVTLALTKPSYAAASGFTPPPSSTPTIPTTPTTNDGGGYVWRDKAPTHEGRGRNGHD